MSGTTAAEIASDLRRQIHSGVLGPGSWLPSGSDVCARYGVAKATANAAMRILHGEGLIATRTGVGCFVRDRSGRVRLLRRSVHESRHGVPDSAPLSSIMNAEATEWLADVVTDVRITPAGAEVASELGIDESDDVLRRIRTMAEDGIPVALVTASFPRSISRGTKIEEKDTGEGGIYARLKELGLEIEHHVERVTCGVATDDEMDRLELSAEPARAPVLRIDRLTVATDGRALGTVQITALADKFELFYEIPDLR